MIDENHEASSLKAFSYFDREGECRFPDRERIVRDARNGVVNVLVLDANVCLLLSNFVRGRTDVAKQRQAREFLLKTERGGIDVAPFLGCIELASCRTSPQLDTLKLDGFGTNVSQALELSEQALVQELPIEPRSAQRRSDGLQTLEHIHPMLRYAYCCFLKIFEIRARGSLKNRAVDNFIEFFDWCESLKCHVPLLAQAAFALFGGAVGAQKLLSMKKNKTPLEVSWGAAWDIVHCWMVQNYLPTVKIDGAHQRAIFVTGDESAAYIVGHCIPRAMFLRDGAPLLSASMVSYEFDYYVDKVDRLNRLLDERDLRRFHRMVVDAVNATPFDNSAVEAEIELLEPIVMALRKPQ